MELDFIDFVYSCPDCGASMDLSDDDVLTCPNCKFSIDLDDYDDYVNGTDESEEDEEYYCEEEDIPDCCLACGGPYPSCMTSCKIFDD